MSKEARAMRWFVGSLSLGLGACFLAAALAQGPPPAGTAFAPAPPLSDHEVRELLEIRERLGLSPLRGPLVPPDAAAVQREQAEFAAELQQAAGAEGASPCQSAPAGACSSDHGSEEFLAAPPLAPPQPAAGGGILPATVRPPAPSPTESPSWVRMAAHDPAPAEDLQRRRARYVAAVHVLEGAFRVEGQGRPDEARIWRELAWELLEGPGPAPAR